MLKPIAVFLLTVMFITGTMQAQTLSNPPQESQLNLKQAVSRETEKIKNESAVIDAKKLDKIERQASQKTSGSNHKVIIAGVVVALVVLAVVLAFTTKRCIKREPQGCSFNDDINCQCVEYAQ
jgi:hypothetical protein